MSKPLVYSYIRFSSKAQQGGDSIARQQEFISSFAQSKGLDIDEATRYEDYGVSGFNLDNIKDDGAL
jgi:DNA invertase Pin-like site-specific DNA recombinase